MGLAHSGFAEPEPFGLVAIDVEHDITGLLFQPRNPLALADAIASLAADTLLRLRRCEAGCLRQQKLFSIKSQAATLERLYLEMTGSAGQGN